MRLVFVVFLISFSFNLKANSNPCITHRIYSGMGVLNIRNNVKLAQIGYYKTFQYNPLVLGIESSIYANSKK